MTNDMPASSLWREGFRAFRQSWRLWARWGVLFAGISVLIDLFAQMTLSDSLKILSDLGARKDQPSIEEIMPLLEQISVLGLSLYFLAQITLTSIAYYVFVIFYTAQETPMGRYGTTSFKGFMSVYWKSFEAWLLATLPLLGGLLVGSLATALTSTPTPLLLALGTGLGASIYLAFRTTLVLPLSAINDESPIRTSWQCTDGQALRLLGNSLVFHILAFSAVLIGLHLPAFGLNLVITTLGQALTLGNLADTATTFVSIVTNSLTSMLSYGLMAAYAVRLTKLLTMRR